MRRMQRGSTLYHQPQMNAIILEKKGGGGGLGSIKTNSRAGWYFHPWGLSTWIPSMQSCSPGVSYLGSFMLKSSASRTVRSAGSSPPLDSSPPGARAPFAGLHDNMTLLYSLQTCQAATNKGALQPLYNPSALYDGGACLCVAAAPT